MVIAAGTFLNGLVHTGRQTYTAGRAGEPASIELAETLKRLGFPVSRLKTGTPPRLDGRTINWDAFEPQEADAQPVPFSFSTDEIEQPQLRCYIGYTTSAVHSAIRENLHESPLYSGRISGVGPRYCPSIEDKVVKFADKDRHQLFLEPEGHNTNEVYLNGFSTLLARRAAAGSGENGPGFGRGQRNSPRVCHRIRLHRSKRVRDRICNVTASKVYSMRVRSTEPQVTKKRLVRA